MRIELKNGYVIISDDYQYIYGKEYEVAKGSRKGEINIQSPIYHKTLKAMLKSIRNKMILDNDATTVDELLEHVNKVEEYLDSVFKTCMGDV